MRVNHDSVAEQALHLVRLIELYTMRQHLERLTIVQLGRIGHGAAVEAARVIVIRAEFIKELVLPFMAPLQAQDNAKLRPEPILALTGSLCHFRYLLHRPTITIKELYLLFLYLIKNSIPNEYF